jgi:hypothetical protein
MEEADNRGVSEEDEFAEAFQEASLSEGNAELSPADNPDNIETEPKVEVPEVKEPESLDQQPGETDEKFEQRYKTLVGIHKHDKESWDAEKAELLQKLESVKQPEPEVKKEIPSELENLLSPEDEEALRSYDEEFDVISQMEGKKRDVAMAKLEKKFESIIQNIKEELKSEIATQVAPASQLVAETQEERERFAQEYHFNAIREAHEDFEKYRDDGSILKWIESKPQYVQKSMVDTYNEGTAENVIELLNDFKIENNLVPRENVVSINKQEKKLAMTAVNTKSRPVNITATSSDDFDSAFEEAMHKQGGS